MWHTLEAASTCQAYHQCCGRICREWAVPPSSLESVIALQPAGLILLQHGEDTVIGVFTNAPRLRRARRALLLRIVEDAKEDSRIVRQMPAEVLRIFEPE
jgi:hypothetical protein